MKVKRKDWKALQRKIERLQMDLRIAEQNALVHVETGTILSSVLVSQLLRHLKLRARHGHAELLSESKDTSHD